MTAKRIYEHGEYLIGDNVTIGLYGNWVGRQGEVIQIGYPGKIDSTLVLLLLKDGTEYWMDKSFIEHTENVCWKIDPRYSEGG